MFGMCVVQSGETLEKMLNCTQRVLLSQCFCVFVSHHDLSSELVNVNKECLIFKSIISYFWKVNELWFEFSK